MRMNAVVTGASKGIGWEISRALAKKGFNLAICSRSEDDLNECKTKLLSLNQNIQVIVKQVDVSNKSQVLSFANLISGHWKTLDVLINNAGVFLPGEIHKEEDGLLEQQIETNLYSAYHLTRALLPLMLPYKRGLIINMCSIASIIAYPNGGSYSISKFALLGFSKVLREELKDRGIKVTAILPGATWSDSWKGVDLPYSRLIETQDIAKAVVGLIDLSDSAVVEELIIRPQKGDL